MSHREFPINTSYPPNPSLIRVSPTIRNEVTGEEYRPVVDLFWNDDTKQVDVTYEGPVSDAAKVFVNQFGAHLSTYIINRMKEKESQ